MRCSPGIGPFKGESLETVSAGRGWELLVLDCSAYFCFPSIRLLSSVEFLCFACNNDGACFLDLVLWSFSVSPMYLLLSLRVTVA